MTIAIMGAQGKMGSMVYKIATSRQHSAIAIDIGDNTMDIICDAVIDFSATTALQQTIAICQHNNCPLICGVTGYNEQQLQLLQLLSQYVPVVHRHNFSIGITVMQQICTLLVDTLPHWQYNIVEQHHTSKTDSPSGTAVTLASKLTGISSTTHSIRSGTTVGIHTIIANGTNESITITHNAECREVFALGAVVTAEQLIAEHTIL